MSTTRGHLFGVPIIQVSGSMYVEDQTNDKQHYTFDDNISASFSVCVSFS